MKKLILAFSLLVLSSPVWAAPDADHDADRAASAFSVVTPASDDYWILTDTSNSGRFAKVATSNVRAALGLGTADTASFAGVAVTGFDALSVGVANSRDGVLVLYSDDNPAATFGLTTAATLSETVSLRTPGSMPTVANSLWNVDADGTSGWTDPATFAAALGTDDNYVTDAEKASLSRLGDLESTDAVTFGSVTGAGSGGLKAGVESTTRGAITLYSNTTPYAVGINSAATPTGTWTLTMPPAAPGGANYLFNVDADGTGGWTDPSTLGGDNLGSATYSNVVSLWTTCSGYLKSDGTCDTPSGTGDMVLANVQSVTGLKTFDSVKLAVKGASTGTTAFENTNNTATNYTLTLPNADGTLARLSDNISGTSAGLSGTPNITVGTVTAGEYLTSAVDGNRWAAAINTVAITADATLGRIAWLTDRYWLANGTNWTTRYLLDSSFIGSAVQAYDADLTTWAGVTPSANGQSLVASANYASMRGLLDLEADTDFAAYGKNPVVVASKATTYTIGTDSANELFGGTVYVTSATTITAPAVAVGQNFTVVTIGDIAVSLDVDANDKMILDGVTLADGDKATNSSKSGDTITCQYYSADGFYCWSGTVLGGHWTDGN